MKNFLRALRHVLPYRRRLILSVFCAVFAAILSAALLGEAPRWYHGAAFALIVGGIWLSARKRT